MPTPGLPQSGFPSKGCHNCRRRRLRCDRSFPSCHKCSSTGEECLGYGALLRWTNAPAIRGKLAGRAPFRPARTPASLTNVQGHTSSTATTQTSISPSLLDPLLNHLSSSSRNYVHHFANSVCRDLVAVDHQNPFRIMIPLISRFDYLHEIVVATSAMHLVALHRFQGRSAPTQLVDALVAKGKAIRLLREAVSSATPTSQAMVLAAIVFFVNLDLIDSGRGAWKKHIEAAEILISSLHHGHTSGSGPQLEASIAPLADAIAADCLTYRIFGSTISTAETSPTAMAAYVQDDIDVLSVLQRAEAHSYHCCPPAILHIILSASRLCSSTEPNAAEVAVSLLAQARALDVREWVYSIQGLSPQDDLEARVSLASAHRAAACLYVLLAVPGVSDEIPENTQQPDDLVLEILYHLSSVPIDHVLLKGTVWPTFMAGAQTDDAMLRSWCIDRLRAVWTLNPFVCPWGYIRTATEMLEEIWSARDQALPSEGGKWNWLQKLKNSGETYLIV